MAEQREPTLDDLLSEPIIRTVMARDGVRGDDIRRLLQHVRARDEHASPAADLSRLRPAPAVEARLTIY